jgi:hypothetical protein
MNHYGHRAGQRQKWAIPLNADCHWEDNFQRLLIVSGSVLVRGCTFTYMGSNISLNTGMGLVGGIPSDIPIADNGFIDVSLRPQHHSHLRLKLWSFAMKIESDTFNFHGMI